MSDISRGEGWWQASDHKWYPPEQHPDVQEPEPEPEPPPPPPPPEPEPGPSSPTPPPSSSNAKGIVVGVLAVAAVALGAFLVFARDDGKQDTVAGSSATNSSNPATSASSSSSSGVALTDAELQARLMTAKDLGSNFTDDTFHRNTRATTLCGTANPDRVVPPTIDVGSAAKTTTGISFQEEIAVFGDATTSGRAFDLQVESYSCSQGTSVGSGSTQSFAFQGVQDRSADLGVEKAVEIDFQSSGFHGQIFIVRTNATVALFAFLALDSADTSTVPDASSVVRDALDRLAS